ncbi:MAG: RNA methyltransferase, partial [Calditrichaeota bacterium]
MKREDIIIVLVKPESPGNIGAVARAMKTSGLSRLRLVNPCDTDHADMRKMAHRSRDIVEQAGHFGHLREAIADCHLVIATTMRKRHNPVPRLTQEQCAQTVFRLEDGHKAALVFGNERNGLSNEELSLCGLHSTIPIATQNPALNLAQSVMLYAHALYRYNQEIAENTYALYPATQEQVEHLFDHLEQAIAATRFVPRDSLPEFLARFRRLLGRAIPEERDLQLLHKIIQI